MNFELAFVCRSTMTYEDCTVTNKGYSTVVVELSTSYI